MKVNEIFHSLQGEGYHTGTSAAFLRLSGCNLRCGFCDTDHVAGREMSAAEIIAELNTLPVRHVVITGGEPTLQLDLELLQGLRHCGWYVQIETNGTIDVAQELLNLIDWVTCSPKSPRTPAIRRIDELKVVFDPADPAMTAAAEALADSLSASGNSAPRLFLQPCDRGDAATNRAITEACISYIMSHTRWRLSLQTHKLTGIR